MSEYFDLPVFNPNNLREAKIKHYIKYNKIKNITYWQHTIILRNYHFTAYLNMIIKFQVI